MKSTKASSSLTDPSKLVQPSSAEAVLVDLQQIQLAVARRAHELFEARDREHGHDWEDWFQAESELLRPVSIAVFESWDRLSIRANVLGFAETELKVSIEPKRIIILGVKSGDSGLPAAASFPDQLLRFVDLPTEVDPGGAMIELQSGVLKFELPKAAPEKAKMATAG